MSSMFVYNQMGGIDEAALDRLSLVTEMRVFGTSPETNAWQRNDECMAIVAKFKESIRFPEIRRVIPNELIEIYEECQARVAIKEAKHENVFDSPFVTSPMKWKSVYKFLSVQTLIV